MPWENIIIKEEWVEEIKKTLNRYPNDVIELYLRQFGLPVYGGRQLIIERIIHAMLIAEQLTGNIQKGLTKKFPLPVGEAFSVLHGQITSLLKIKKKVPNFEELMNFIDELAKNGHQHIFLYQLKPDARSYLNELRRKEDVLKSLKKFRCGSYYNKNCFVWDARIPKLAQVKHKYESGRGELLYKWVETRSWLEHDGQDDKGRPVYIPSKERSVNFFRVDLRDGTAEIRLQKLNSNPDKLLQDEFDIYCKEICKLLSFDMFFAVPLDPIMKRLLKGRDMQITYWEGRLKGKPKGKDRLSGNTDPSIFNKLELILKKYSSQKLHGDWADLDNIWGPEKVHTKFDGNKNKILITRPCDALQLESILRIIKGSQLERIRIPEIRKLIEKRKDLKPILATIDSKLVQSKENKVSAAELKELWFQKIDIIVSFFELDKTSQKFKVQKNKKEDDQFLIYKQMLGGLMGLLERKLGKEFSKTSLIAFPALLYLIVFIGLNWITAKLFLPLLKKAGVGFPFMAITYLIVLACILAFAIPIFGKDEIKDAIEFIKELRKAVPHGDNDTPPNH